MGVAYAEVIGDPIDHSKSPLIHKLWLEKLGIEGDYRAMRVTPPDLSAYLAARKTDPFWRGCNVTMPLKSSATAMVDVTDPSSIWTGSTNCLFWNGRSLVACNTDTTGIAMAVGDIRLQSEPAVIIGSGAAARSALWVLREKEVGEVRVIARDPRVGAAQLTEFGLFGRVHDMSDAVAACSGAALVINATPLGMAGFPLMPELILEGIRHTRTDGTIFDMVYFPARTELLAESQRLGRRTVDGLTMLVEQARDSFGKFFDGDARALRAFDPELRELLAP
jgi:shikimate dehydrogenase